MNIGVRDGTQATAWGAVFLLQFIVITTVLCKILSEMRIDLMCGIWYNYLNV